MNYREIHHFIVEQLHDLYPQQEATTIAYRLMETYCAMTKIDIALSTVDNLEINPQIANAIERMKKGEPLQYVLGFADFYDLQFVVNPAVLIPRPETEELVELVLSHMPNHTLNILDIGTGSGCIPISIKKNRAHAQVSACDISSEALAIAQQNAQNHNVEVHFFQTDILSNNLTDKYDIIVSNPPYVTPSEMQAMRNNVLDYEPHIALFVSEQTPLVFYERIAELATQALLQEGWLFFEINENFALQTINMLKEKAFVNIEVYQDIFGKDRLVKAQRPHL